MPNKVKTVPTTTLGEVKRTRAPAVLVEVAYHDNTEDADWIRNNIDEIARNLVLSLADYFDIPFNLPDENARLAYVSTPRGGNLNVRQRPDIYSPIVGVVPNGAAVMVYYDTGSWSLVVYRNLMGYVNNNYLS